ncbi:MAG: BMP family ABC transporter substrate-binding protein, partial [Actinomycetota bacterium]|nr:BMP family ABC transporter substrate-binding protein [Actinomycetota bacterium]
RDRRRTAVGAVGRAGAIAAAGALAFALAGATDIAPSTPPEPLIALIVPRRPVPGLGDPLITALADGLHRSERDFDVETTTIILAENDPSAEEVAQVSTRLRQDDYGLVIFFGFSTAEVLAPTLADLPNTHVVLLDASARWTRFDELPRATGLRFADEQAGYLVGYLSGLMEARNGPRLNRQRVVSAIGGVQGVPAVDELMRGFARGAERALPGVTILSAYSDDFGDRSSCEAIANEHIDAGADIVFSAAGACSLGALSAAAIRGVWGIGVDGNRSYLGDHILASAEKQLDESVVVAVRSFVQGTLPAGKDVILGLDDDAVGITGISPEVPDAIRQEVGRAAADLRQGREP